MSFVHRLVSWLREETAQTMAEYGLILALVSIVAIVALLALGPEIKDAFTAVADAIGGVA
ncbi:MAG: Flp family type IVb pilin [Dehalococcoidia bacterium]|nr:Flp family type IVb pilin [Dehalococcoidia bacterium]